MIDAINVSHVHLETPLTISPDSVQLLIIESPDEFYSTVASLDKQLNGDDGDFIFSKNGEPLSPSKSGIMLCDTFHFDLNDKKILNILYKRLETNVYEENLPRLYDLNSNNIAFIENLAYSLPFLLEYDEPQPNDYFKLLSLRFAKNYTSLEEKIICYINALIELKKCEFFVFVNLKSVLSDEKLLQIYTHCQKEQVGLLLLESEKRRPLLPCEKAIIITNDLCEILENYSDMC